MPSTAKWTSQPPPIAATKTRRSLAQQVRDATADGTDVVTVLVTILHDETAAHRDRIHAGSILLDRGWGTSVQTSVVLQADASQSEALAQLADAELERLAASLGPAPLTLSLGPVPAAVALEAPAVALEALPAVPAASRPAAVARGALAAHGPLPDAPVEFLEATIPPPGYPRDAPRPVLDTRPYVNGVPVGPAPEPVAQVSEPLEPVTQPNDSVDLPPYRPPSTGSSWSAQARAARTGGRTGARAAGPAAAADGRPKAGGEGGSDPLRPPRAGTKPP